MHKEQVFHGHVHGPAETEAKAKGEQDMRAGMNCIKIGLPGKLILGKRKVLQEVIFS